MIYKATTCEKCGKNFDDRLDVCPHCHTKNETINKTRLDKTTYLPIYTELLLFFGGWLGFQLIGLIASLIGALIFPTDSIVYSALVNFTAYSILFLALVLTIFPNYKPLLKTFKGWKPYVFAIAGFISIIFFNLVYNSAISLFYDITDNNNESTVNALISGYPFLSIIILGIIGPICEELTYRVGLFSFAKRIHVALAYPLTIIVFALIHFDFTATNIVNELLNLPIYMYAAGVLTFLYHYFGFACSVACHITNNLFSVLATILIE